MSKNNEEMLEFHQTGGIKNRDHADDHEPKKNMTLNLPTSENLILSEKKQMAESLNAKGKGGSIRVRPYIKSKESGILNLQEV